MVNSFQAFFEAWKQELYAQFLFDLPIADPLFFPANETL